MPRALIALGSNLGDRRALLDEAAGRLAMHPDVGLLARSREYETAPAGGPAGQPAFLNAAALVETGLRPEPLLSVLQRIEAELGRQRRRRWGPRTVDLDLLLYDRAVIDTPSLQLPHPRMAFRRFVLEPAAEVAGEMIHPLIGWSVARLLEHLSNAPPYVAITGGIASGKSRLAERVAAARAARLIAEPVDAVRLEAFYANPPSLAWPTELEFLNERVRLLEAGSPAWRRGDRLAVSDFWFDQSLAFAHTWLPPEQSDAFRQRFAEARRRVVTPKLIVLLDLPGEVLAERVRRRGRRYELGLRVEQLEAIRRAVAAEATAPGRGPVLRLTVGDGREALREVLAAIVAMG